MDAGERVSGGLIITGRDSSELLELADEILNQMARLVHLSIKIARHLARTLGRDHWDFACCQEAVDHSLIDIERFIGQHGISFHLRQQRVGALEIMRLTAVRKNASGLPRASTIRWIFVLNPPLLRPIAWSSPAFFGRQRYVGGHARSSCSIMAYSLSASAAKISNIFFQMPLLAQREKRV